MADVLKVMNGCRDIELRMVGIFRDIVEKVRNKH